MFKTRHRTVQRLEKDRATMLQFMQKFIIQMFSYSDPHGITSLTSGFTYELCDKLGCSHDVGQPDKRIGHSRHQ